jgi:hypothetical protein
MSPGAKVAVFLGIAGVALLVLIVVLVVTLSRRGPRGPGRGETYIVNLNEGGKDVRQFHFAAGRQVTIRVTSDLNTDVDLHVYDPFNNMIAWDTRPDKDCFASFRVPVAGVYRVEIVNLGPGGNRSVVSYN